MEPTSSSPADDREPLTAGGEYPPDPASSDSVSGPLPPASESDAGVVPIDPSPVGSADAAPADAGSDPEPNVDEPAAQPVADLALEEPDVPAPVGVDFGDIQKPTPTPGAATDLDLPSLELPYQVAPNEPATPLPPSAAPAAGAVPAGSSTGDYVENLARQSYGEPSASPQTPYAASPYASQPDASGRFAEPTHLPPQATPAYGQSTPFGQPQQQPQPGYGQTYAQPSYAQPPQYGQQPLYGQQPSYGQAGYGQMVPASTLSPSEQNTWATAAHWSTLLASVVGLPFLGPLLVMLIQGPKDARVRANAVESLNFDLTCTIAMIASMFLMIILIGLITAPLVGLAWLVFKIVATAQTSSGRDYRYPISIRMVK